MILYIVAGIALVAFGGLGVSLFKESIIDGYGHLHSWFNVELFPLFASLVIFALVIVSLLGLFGLIT